MIMKKTCWIALILLAGIEGFAQRSDDTLPVMFDSVRAIVEPNGIGIGWSNLTERDVSLYVVERSPDGRAYTPVATFTPLSNKNDRSMYFHLDARPHSGTSFYRVRVNIQFSSKIIYSRILKVETQAGTSSFSVYPNPVAGRQVNFSLSGMNRGKYSYRIVGSFGQELMAGELVNPGEGITQTIQLPLAVKPGMYTCVLTGQDATHTKMLLVQ